MPEWSATFGAHRNFRLQFGLIALLLAIAGLSALLGGYRAYRIRFERTHPDVVAFRKLHDAIRNGATLAEVTKQLPGLKMLPAASVPSYVHDAAIAAPSGWLPGDQHAQLIVPPPSLRWTIHLQFRQGRLINHNPADFASVPELVGTAGP